MKALLVHAHSETDSFVSAMRDTIMSELSAQNVEIVQSDLYAMQFNPVLSPADFHVRNDGEHLTYALEQRHGFETRTLAPDILVEIDKVLSADILIFTFPVFWFSVPAILKGWIDRVFISGPFYGGKRIYARGGLSGKRAFAAFSLGGREHMFGANALHGPLETGMLRHFLQGALGYVGLDVLEPFAAYHTPYLSEQEREATLDELRSQVKILDKRGILPMPDLDAFDATLRPRS